GEDDTFLGDAVDVQRANAHHAQVVGAEVPVPNVVGEDDDDVRLLAVTPVGGNHLVVIGGRGRGVLGGGGIRGQAGGRARDGGLHQGPPGGGAVVQHRGYTQGVVLGYYPAVFARHAPSFPKRGNTRANARRAPLGPLASCCRPLRARFI